jgi:hypothetical protein
VLTNDLLRFRWFFTEPFGLALPALVPISSEDPWAPRYSYKESHATNEFLDAQMRSWKALGWFDPSVYSTRGPEADALTEILTRSSRLAPHTVVILMPETSTLRANAPSAAEASFRGALSTTGFSFPVVDLRESIPDSLFYDNAHLNATGRRRFSRTLAASLRRLITCRNESPAS